MDRRREREEKKRRREEKEQRPRDPSTRSPQGPLRNSPTTSPQPCLRKVYYSLSNFTSASTGPSKGDYATSLVGRQRCPLFSSDIKLNYDLFKGRNSADSMRLRFDKKKKLLRCFAETVIRQSVSRRVSILILDSLLSSTSVTEIPLSCN